VPLPVPEEAPGEAEEEALRELREGAPSAQGEAAPAAQATAAAQAPDAGRGTAAELIQEEEGKECQVHTPE